MVDGSGVVVTKVKELSVLEAVDCVGVGLEEEALK